MENLGEGSFGEVFKCYDYKKSTLWLNVDKELVALKIVKHNDKYAEQAKSEISILSLIKKEDPTASKNCIELKECFVWRDRVVILFINSVYDF